MKSFVRFLTLATALLRAETKQTTGQTLIVANFPEQSKDPVHDPFLAMHRDHFRNNDDKLTYIKNPLLAEEITKINGEFLNVLFSSHGGEAVNGNPPQVYLFGEGNPTYVTDAIRMINHKNLEQAHFSACFIGSGLEKFDLNITNQYRDDLNMIIGPKLSLMLHGDNYTSVTSEKSLEVILSDKRNSIIEYLFNSGEQLRVVSKDQNGRLMVFAPKPFGRDGEKYKVENFRNYIKEVAQKAKEFEVSTGMLSEDAPRLDIDQISDAQIEEIMGKIFTIYSMKLADAKDFEKFRVLNKSNIGQDFLKPVLTELMEQRVLLNDFESVNILIENGFDKTSRNNFFEEPILANAVSQDKNLEMLKYLIEEQGFDPHVIADPTLNSTLLTKASIAGASQIVEYLIQQGLNPHHVCRRGDSCLITAVMGGHLEVVQVLLKHDHLDINKPNIYEGSPLNIAFKRLHYGIVEALVKKGANTSIISPQEWSDAINSNPDKLNGVIKKLRNKKVELSLRGEALNSAFYHCVTNGDIKNAQYFLQQGADVNQRDALDASALMVAARSGDIAMAKLLLQNKADVNAVDNEGSAALIFAASNDHHDMLLLLMDKKADPNLANNFNWSPLMYASRNGNTESVIQLLQHGANPILENLSGESAKELAERNGFTEITQILDNPSDIKYKPKHALPKTTLRGGKTGNTPLSATEAIILGAGVSIILTASALMA